MVIVMLNTRILPAALAALSFCAFPLSAALAAPQDYRFDVVKVAAAGSGKTDVTVAVVRTAGAKPVPGAVITESTADMGPSGMATMPAKTAPLGESKDGTRTFEVQAGMKGKWALHLAATVPAETEAVRGTVTFDAK
jgi:hypothetical protein